MVNPISANPSRGVGTVPAPGWPRVGLSPPHVTPYAGDRRCCPHPCVPLGWCRCHHVGGSPCTGGAGAQGSPGCREPRSRFPPVALCGGGRRGADPEALIPLMPRPPAASAASPPLGNRGWYVGAPVGPACRCRRPGAAPGPAPATGPPATGPLSPPAQGEGTGLPPVSQRPLPSGGCSRVPQGSAVTAGAGVWGPPLHAGPAAGLSFLCPARPGLGRALGAGQGALCTHGSWGRIRPGPAWCRFLRALPPPAGTDPAAGALGRDPPPGSAGTSGTVTG